MADYKSFDGDHISKLRLLQKQRLAEHQLFQREVQKLQQAVVVKPIQEKFASKKSTEEDRLHVETLGLQSLDDFKKKRQRIECDDGQGNNGDELNSRVRKRSKVEEFKPSRLSFTLNDEEEENSEENADKSDSNEVREFKKLGKDPSVDTSFLPDKERDEFLEFEKRRLRTEWLDKQEEIKKEPLKIDYCFYDGTSHTKAMTLTKGSSIKQFLDASKRQFSELRDVSTDHLLLVKNDLIVPHHYTFYELIEANQGKTGPLCVWSVEGVSNSIMSLRAHSKLAKIVERPFYEKHKHTYPFMHWKVYTEPSSSPPSNSLSNN